MSIQIMCPQLLYPTILIAGAFLGALSTATPTSNSATDIDVPEGLKIMAVTESAGVQLVWYGDADSASTANSTSDLETPSLSRRCGSNMPKCYSSYQAYALTCEALLNGLLTSGSLLRTSPRSVCSTIGGYMGNRCCTSWADNLLNGHYYNLQNGAEAILNKCRTNEGWVSGKSYDTLLGSTCTTQCLSNRPNSCNNG
ncbi:hypothetical protein QBC32DRAFT_353212 [Pseudoneurospora amorphoporcata]|uniref:WD-like domain-containing protein n=1 Tax=Pseudoneurospora amorphoporcata TaxID=241081 RepID=A0AAN6NL29_9PEZI|nr:hypothetical protein QBC32DRAFT_353212 [Pseudoneurospora amorphoporcata]